MSWREHGAAIASYLGLAQSDVVWKGYPRVKAALGREPSSRRYTRFSSSGPKASIWPCRVNGNSRRPTLKHELRSARLPISPARSCECYSPTDHGVYVDVEGGMFGEKLQIYGRKPQYFLRDLVRMTLSV